MIDDACIARMLVSLSLKSCLHFVIQKEVSCSELLCWSFQSVSTQRGNAITLHGTGVGMIVVE